MADICQRCPWLHLTCGCSNCQSLLHLLGCQPPFAVHGKHWLRTAMLMLCAGCCARFLLSAAEATAAAAGLVFGSVFTSVLGSNSLVLRTQRRVFDQPVLFQMVVRGVVFTVRHDGCSSCSGVTFLLYVLRATMLSALTSSRARTASLRGFAPVSTAAWQAWLCLNRNVIWWCGMC